jgi:hypothetical protein
VNPSQGTFPNLFALCRNDLSLSAEKLALKVEQIAQVAARTWLEMGVAQSR